MKEKEIYKFLLLYFSIYYDGPVSCYTIHLTSGPIIIKENKGD